jgi:hypothetical protein
MHRTGWNSISIQGRSRVDTIPTGLDGPDSGLAAGLGPRGLGSGATKESISGPPT